MDGTFSELMSSLRYLHMVSCQYNSGALSGQRQRHDGLTFHSLGCLIQQDVCEDPFRNTHTGMKYSSHGASQEKASIIENTYTQQPLTQQDVAQRRFCTHHLMGTGV